MTHLSQFNWSENLLNVKQIHQWKQFFTHLTIKDFGSRLIKWPERSSPPLNEVIYLNLDWRSTVKSDFGLCEIRSKSSSLLIPGYVIWKG
jgi:hypothetical protein